MGYKFISDSHIHSDNTTFASDPIVKICETATSKNFYSITIVDIYECDNYRENNSKKTITQSFFETKMAADIFKEDLKVFSGVELSGINHNQKAARDAIKNLKFDYVAASLHRLRNSRPFCDLDYSALSADDINAMLNKYFDEILEILKFKKFDVLSHLCYPLKFIPNSYDVNSHFHLFKQKVDLILKTLAKNKKALEINTSIQDFPKESIFNNSYLLKTFKNVGGEFVTIGSGAHEHSLVGYYIPEVLEVVKDSGFENFTVYKAHHPTLLPVA